MTQESDDNKTAPNMEKRKINGNKKLKRRDVLLNMKMTGEPVDKLIRITEKFEEKSIFVEYASSTEISEYFGEEVTGSEENIKKVKEIRVPFDKYIIKVGLSPTNEFLGITEIEISKDFRSEREKMKSKPFYDVDKYYEE